MIAHRLLKGKKKVLFICTHNSARSQMAEAFLRTYYGDYYQAFSAGTHPSGVNPSAIAVMNEIGIDISDCRSKSINRFMGEKFDYVITVCDKANQTCPFFPNGKVYLHAIFEDPSKAEGSQDEILNTFRKIRDEIQIWIKTTFKTYI